MLLTNDPVLGVDEKVSDQVVGIVVLVIRSNDLHAVSNYLR